MSSSVDILFLDSQTLGQSKSLEAIFQVFIANQFEVRHVRVADEIYDADIEMFRKAYVTQAISFSAVNDSWPIEVFQQIAWGETQMGGERRAYIRTSTESVALWREEYDNSRYCTLFLELGKHLYEVVKPSFGWIDLYHGWTTTHEDIESINLTHLYWANFFGPRYMECIGRDKILNAPAWDIEELSDGGLLYLLAPHLGNTDEHVSTTAVREYFDVENVR